MNFSYFEKTRFPSELDLLHERRENYFLENDPRLCFDDSIDDDCDDELLEVIK